jgi:hypothetical protein
MTRHHGHKPHHGHHPEEHKKIEQPVREKIEQKPIEKPVTPTKKDEPKESISWKAAEFHYIEKDVLWHTGIVLAGVLLLIFAFAGHNLFFGIFVVIATILVMEFGRRRPRILEYAVTKDGLLLDKKLYLPYEKIESFRIHKRQNRLDEVVFKKTSKANPFLYVPVDEKTALVVQEFLLSYLPEDEHDESFAEIIAEWIGF